MAQENIQKFLNYLKSRYAHLFDIYEEGNLDDIPLAFTAVHKRRDERYMLSKKFKIYGFENQEIAFTTVHEEALKVDDIDRFIKSMENNFKAYMKEHEEHMSTIIYGIIVTNETVDQTIAKKVRNYRKVKFLKFGLHGWVELYLIVVNLKDNKLWVHPKGKPLVKIIENYFNMESAVKCH